MSIRICFDIQHCEQCPYHKTERVYTPDSFESVRKVYCSDLKKDVHNYLDWNESAEIPKECRFNIE